MFQTTKALLLKILAFIHPKEGIMNQSSLHPSSSSSNGHQGWALLALAAAVLLWGTSYAAAKTALGSFSPSVLIALRMVMASLVLLPFWRRLPKKLFLTVLQPSF